MVGQGYENNVIKGEEDVSVAQSGAADHVVHKNIPEVVDNRRCSCV